MDRSLRRLLRDDEGVDLALRLKALAPDEIRVDAILAELRRVDRVPMELAAGIHEVLESRRRMEGDGEPTDADIARTVAVFDALEATLRTGSVEQSLPLGGVSGPESPSATSTRRPLDATHPRFRSDPVVSDEADAALAAPSGGTTTRSWVIASVLVVAALAVLAIWLLRGFGPDPMATGIDLFEEGQYAEAAQHFWRYSEDHPDELLPQLYLARIHRRMNRPELAAEAIREAERIAPDDPAVDRELGFLLLDAGRPDVAVERFRTAVEQDNTSSAGWIGLVRALRESGRESDVDAVIAQAPAEVQALLRRPAAVE